MRAARLAQLRQEIQDGLDSGPTVAWDAEARKRAGCAKRKAKSGSEVVRLFPRASVHIAEIWNISQKTARRRQMLFWILDAKFQLLGEGKRRTACRFA